MKFSITAFAVAATVGLSACQPTPTTVSTSGVSNLNIVNNSGRTAFYIYLSPCSSSTWGQDRLGSGEALSAGGVRSISLPSGCWDMRASADATNPDASTWLQRNVQLSGGSFDWTLMR